MRARADSETKRPENTMPSQARRSSRPEACRSTTPLMRSAPSMRVSSVSMSTRIPRTRGSRVAARQAVGRLRASTMATGLMPAWRQVRSAENDTSSVPTITGRANGLRDFRYTMDCSAPVVSTPMGLAPETRRADRGVSRTPVARRTRSGSTRARPSGVDTRSTGPRPMAVTVVRGTDVHAGGFGGFPQARGIVGTLENAAELPEAEGRMAAVTGDAPGHGLPFENDNLPDPEALQPRGGAEPCRAAAHDGHVAPDDPVVHDAGSPYGHVHGRLQEARGDLTELRAAVEPLAASHGDPGPALESGQGRDRQRALQRVVDLSPGDQFAVADDAAVAGTHPVPFPGLADLRRPGPPDALGPGVPVSIDADRPAGPSGDAERRAQPVERMPPRQR